MDGNGEIARSHENPAWDAWDLYEDFEVWFCTWMDRLLRIQPTHGYHRSEEDNTSWESLKCRAFHDVSCLGEEV